MSGLSRNIDCRKEHKKLSHVKLNWTDRKYSITLFTNFVEHGKSNKLSRINPNKIQMFIN